MKHLLIVGKSYTGLMADISELLSQANLNITKISAEQLESTALVKLESCDAEAAFQVLTDAGFNVVSRDGLLVRVNDEPGALARVSRMLAEHDIDIRGLNMVEQHDGVTIMNISCSDPDRAREVLSRQAIQVH